MNKSKTCWKMNSIFYLAAFLFVILSSTVFADLYLNSRTGYVNLNTTGQTRLQITPGGNLNLLGLVNVSIPGNLSVSGNVSVDGSSLFVDSESNRVGIGTTSPINRLSVFDGGANTTSTIVTSPTVGIFDTSGNTGIVVKKNDSGTEAQLIAGASNVIIGSASNHPLRIRTNNQVRIYVENNTGSVGIGTASPIRQAQIYGAGQTTAALTDSGAIGGTLLVSDSGTSAGAGGAIGLSARNDAGTDVPQAAIKSFLINGGTNGVSDLAFSTRNAVSDTALTERMRITNGGNVGIGTTSPGELLHLSSSSPEQRFNDTDNSNYWDIGTSGNGFKIALNDSTTDGIFIDQNGYVGIGKTSPSFKLEIHDASDPTLRLEDTTNNARLDLRAENSSVLIRSTSNYPMRFDVNQIERMRIDTGGSVGIGTTGPSAELEVIGTIKSSLSEPDETGIELGNTATEKPVIRFKMSDDTTRGKIELVDANTASERLGIFLNPLGTLNEIVSVAEGGSVGIGTTSPQAELHINSSGTTQIDLSASGSANLKNEIRFRNGTDVKSMLRTDIGADGTNNIGFYDFDATVYRFVIEESGNVKLPYLASNGGEDRYACIDSATGNLTDKGSACSTSSIRFKENIRESNYGLKEVMQLRQVRYNYKKEKDPDKDANNTALKKDHIGFIAEEMLQLMPELIYFDQDGNVDNIRYEAMPSVLAKAIQDLKKEKDKEISNLKQQNEKLKSDLIDLKNKFQTLDSKLEVNQ
jgi:hypothetical protein